MIKRWYDRQKRKFFTCGLLFLCILLFCNQRVFLWSQAKNAVRSGAPLACFIVVQNIASESASQTQTYEQLITDTLKLNLKQAGFLILSYEEYLKKNNLTKITNEDLQSSSGLIKLGQQMGANLAFVSLFKIAQASLQMTIKCYNIKENRIINGVMKKSILGLAAYNVIDKSINALVKDVAENSDIFRIDQQVQDITTKTENSLINISLLSEDEGAEVLINGEKSAGTILNGCLNVYTLNNAELLIELKKKGYHPQQILIKIEETKRSYALPRLIKETRWATELYYTSSRFPNLGLAQRYYFWPDLFYLRLDNDFCYTTDTPDLEGDLFNNIRLSAGYYLFSTPEQNIRVSVAAGLGLLLSFTEAEKPPATDYYINICNLAIETELKEWAFFLQIEFKYALGIGQNVQGQSWFTGWGVWPPLTLGVFRKW